jgi:hypothetical protein
MGNVPRRDHGDRHAEGNQKVCGFGHRATMRPAKSKLRAVFSGTGDLISCDFAPMICDMAPLLTRPCARLWKLGWYPLLVLIHHGASLSQETAIQEAYEPDIVSRPLRACSTGYGCRFDTRVAQAFMGHRSIANTVIYTAVADKRIRNIWGK